MATYNQLSDGRPDGTQLGQAAADKIAFHGNTPIVQYTAIADQSIAALSVSGVVGFTSSTSLSSVVEKLNSILDLLRDYGLLASS
jgi:hypothetical protein